MFSILRSIAAMFMVALLLAAAPVRAADPPSFTAEQLDQMLAPIALFPDALLSQVLMASTYPSDVTQAADWAFANREIKGDDAVKAVQDKLWENAIDESRRRLAPKARALGIYTDEDVFESVS